MFYKELVRNPKLNVRSSYLAMIRGSVGTEMFRSRYYHIHDRSLDVLEDGDLSCAIYVTSILCLFRLIQKLHTTVVGTIADMECSGWYKIDEPKTGAVILWDYKKLRGGKRGANRHVGFYIDEHTAISNSSKKRKVTKHHPTYGINSYGIPKRDVLAYYWNTSFD